MLVLDTTKEERDKAYRAINTLRQIKHEIRDDETDEMLDFAISALQDVEWGDDRDDYLKAEDAINVIKTLDYEKVYEAFLDNDEIRDIIYENVGYRMIAALDGYNNDEIKQKIGKIIVDEAMMIGKN